MAAESLQEAVQRLNAKFPHGVEAGAIVILVEEVTAVLREEVQRLTKLLDAEIRLRQTIEAVKDSQTEHIANLLLVKEDLEKRVRDQKLANDYRQSLVTLLAFAKAVYPTIAPNVTAAIAIEQAERVLHE